jgi:translation initiation factor IF-3
MMTLSDAIKAALDKEMDLVEVSSSSVSPVCRILDFGKFRYEQTKKEKEARKGQKTSEVREVRMRPRIDDHDIAFKSKMVQRFLEEGHKVKMTVLFRGREITHPEQAINLMRRVAEEFAQQAKLEKPPAMEGRAMTMMLAPISGAPKKSATGKAEEETSAKA